MPLRVLTANAFGRLVPRCTRKIRDSDLLSFPSRPIYNSKNKFSGGSLTTGMRCAESVARIRSGPAFFTPSWGPQRGGVYTPELKQITWRTVTERLTHRGTRCEMVLNVYHSVFIA